MYKIEKKKKRIKYRLSNSFVTEINLTKLNNYIVASFYENGKKNHNQKTVIF